MTRALVRKEYGWSVEGGDLEVGCFFQAEDGIRDKGM